MPQRVRVNSGQEPRPVPCPPERKSRAPGVNLRHHRGPFCHLRDRTHRLVNLLRRGTPYPHLEIPRRKETIQQAIPTHHHNQTESRGMETARMREVVIQGTKEEEEVGTMTDDPSSPPGSGSGDGRTLIPRRALGIRAVTTTIQSPKRSAVTEGWEQEARQQGKMMIILETSLPNSPPHPPRDQGRSWSPRSSQRNPGGENRRPRGEGIQCTCRLMHSTQDRA